MKPIIGLDLDGVIRHNNKSLGTGDIPKEKRNKKDLLELYQKGELPKGYYCTKPEDVIFIDGALDALAMFFDMACQEEYDPSKPNRKGIPAAWDCYVISNQEAVGLGIMSMADLQLVTAYMDGKITEAGGQIENWYMCTHAPEDNCDCRKPKSKMFHDLHDDYGVDLSQMYYIGDNPSDMEAGKKAGCKTIHIVLPTAESEFQHSEYADEKSDSLLSVAKMLVARHGKE